MRGTSILILITNVLLRCLGALSKLADSSITNVLIPSGRDRCCENKHSCEEVKGCLEKFHLDSLILCC